MNRRALTLALALAGCTAPTAELECRHGEVRVRGTQSAGRADVVVVVDGASFAPEAAPIVAERAAALVGRIVERGEIEELTLGVVNASRGPELGRFTAPAECGGAAGQIQWAAALGAPIDGALDAAACRVAASARASEPWQPGEALANLFQGASVRRAGAALYVVLVTAGDAPSADFLRTALEGVLTRDASLFVVAGYPIDDDAFAREPIEPPAGCAAGPIDAAPAPALHEAAARLARLGAVHVDSVCAPRWDRLFAPIALATFSEPLGCLPRRPLLDAEGLPRCEAIETLPDDGFLDRCDRLPGRELADPDGDPRRCRWRLVTPAEAAAGARGAFASDDLSECFEERVARLAFTDAFAAGARIELRCATDLSDVAPCE